jgi:hypothetical protein
VGAALGHARLQRGGRGSRLRPTATAPQREREGQQDATRGAARARSSEEPVRPTNPRHLLGTLDPGLRTKVFTFEEEAELGLVVAEPGFVILSSSDTSLGLGRETRSDRAASTLSRASDTLGGAGFKEASRRARRLRGWLGGMPSASGVYQAPDTRWLVCREIIHVEAVSRTP